MATNLSPKATLEIKVHPRSSQLKLILKEDGWHGYIMVPPVEGEANDALIELVSEQIKHPKTKIKIVSGHQSRKKRLEFEGIDEAELLLRLN